MAQTPDEMMAEIAYTRQQLGQMLDELNRAVARTKRRIPFYGMERRQSLTIVAGAGLAFLTVFVVALYASQRRSYDARGVSGNCEGKNAAGSN